MNLEDRCQQIELILSDVDGVLTDGGIIFNNQGIESKKFHVRDGLGVKLWQRAGYKFGILTARASHIVRVRAAELEIEIVRQGFQDKLPAAQDVIREVGLTAEQTCFIGDDLTDLPVMRHAGLAVAVADATLEVRESAAFVTRLAGGHGAVRETIEWLLKSKNRWEEILRRYE